MASMNGRRCQPFKSMVVVSDLVLSTVENSVRSPQMFFGTNRAVTRLSMFVGVIVARSSQQKPVVLVVEDEVLIRMHAADMVRDLGFEAVEAGNADEAISLLESRSEITV